VGGGGLDKENLKKEKNRKKRRHNGKMESKRKG
jgi:hypothetical protein